MAPGRAKGKHDPREVPVASDPIRRALEDNQDWYRDLVEHSQDLLCVHDLEGRFLSVNPASARLMGYSVEEMLGMPMRDFVDSQFRSHFDAYLREIERTGESRGLLALVTRSGEKRIWEYHNTLRTEGVTAPIVRGMAHDVTERVRAETTQRETNDQLLKAVREQERLLHDLTLFRALLDQSNDVIQVVDPKTLRFLDVNQRACVALGYSREELLSLNMSDVNPDFDESSRARLEQRLRESGSAIKEIVLRRKDGTTFPVEANVRRVRLDRDYDVAVLRDITERRRAEEALKESERRQQLALQIGKIGAFELDMESGRGTWTTEFAEIWGIPSGFAGDFATLFRWEQVHPEDRARIQAEFAQLVQSREEGESELRVTRPDGVMRWIRGRARVIADTATGSLRVVGVNMDITESKRAEEALRKAEERFRVALTNSPTAVFSQDRDLRYTWMYNPQLPRSASEYLGKTPDEVFGPEEAARFTEVRRRVLETGVGVRHEMQISYGGRKRYFDTTIEPVFDSGGAVIGITAASTEVTELREVTEKLRAARRKLTEEKLYLEQEINTELGFDEIIGQSKILKGIMEQAATVAPSDATVLLLGETGTGKELIARAVHGLSNRRGESFIKMNCAAIPEGLLESELFGYEKGAFTGAAGKKVGRVELADKGTLFLDEIGEIPLALQPKLLRLVQDHEFERLGGTQTLKSDFRLIAATNRDLLHRVNEQEFRRDLYYRLNVFPIHLPSLRERREDISLLVEYFVQKFARQMKKSITSIPKRTMESLTQWDWPGNIRELENFVERSVILTNGSVLACPLGELSSNVETSTDDTLEEVERKHILDALRESRGQLSGPTGAAARLGLKRTTLQSKLKQLGIDHRSYRNDEKRRTA
jgi:PAS domain S-box-containing protein